jgi:carbon-monoxide dehydrogenase large subunit
MADLAAHEVGIDPAEIRRRNFVPPDGFPYETPLGYTYDSGDYRAALDRACDRIGYDRRRAGQRAARAEGRLVGIGLAVTIERAGGLWESGEVVVEPGGDVIVRTGSPAHGQGHETTFAQIAAEVLDVDLERVRVEAGDTAEVPEGVGTFGSRSVTVGGAAVFEAATEVRERALAIAGRTLGVPEREITWRGGAAVAGDRELSLATLAAASGGRGLSGASRFTSPGPVFPYGAYAVAIEVDPDTGTVFVERIVAIDDAGRLVNPLLAEGQVVGATVQGLGQALLEEMVHDDDAQPLTGNLALYAIPSATDVPPIESEFLQTPSPFNPLGAKGVGESGSIALPAALANAVADALAPLGVAHLDPPYTPEKLWRAIRGR